MYFSFLILMGERSPHNNPDARGTFIGMSMDTTRADMTPVGPELPGSVLAFAIRDSFEIARSLGIPITRDQSRSAAAEPRALSWRRIWWPTCLAFPWTS